MNEKVTYFAMGGGVPHYDLLGSNCEKQWSAIQKYLSNEWENGDHKKLLEISGCLEKLATSLLQVSRVRDFYEKELVQNAKSNAGKGSGYAFIRGTAPCADFESLILQSSNLWSSSENSASRSSNFLVSLQILFFRAFCEYHSFG
ncbi:hypothetical protein BTA51_13335 [Hahella sp. CCB-MM4]|uniref:hypothetical protein n=1 Tax=Hahella sp. (strain CCB-MM4) TaxID=1926491 RepID=UPI000B9ACDCC|nr:hypothetical protein [Hahella sp. CCB-MM4]OZG72938.1 hypothetical protein BTA51_13335 [Hahella sp. CCB-MM4]